MSATNIIKSDCTVERPSGRGAPVLNTQITPSSGSRAWWQVLAGFFLFFNSWGLSNAFGVFQAYYRIDLISESSNSDISWIGSITSFLIAASPIVWGPVFDQGHPRMLVCFGSFFVVLGMTTTSFCTQFWQLFLAQGVCCGIGAGGLFITSISIIPTYFTKHRALALGVAASGSSVAGIVYPIVFHQLQPRIGFPWTVRVIALTALVTLSIPCALIRLPSTPRPRRKLFDTKILKDKTYQILNLASLAGFLGQFIPFFYAELFADKHDVSKTVRQNILVFLSAGSFFGRILPGLAADRIAHPMWVLTACTFAAAVLAYGWIAMTKTASFLVFSILYGFFSGALVSLQPASVASISKDMSTIGTRLGVNATFAAVGALLGSPIAGILQRQSWLSLQFFCASALLLAAVATLLAKAVLEHQEVHSSHCHPLEGPETSPLSTETNQSEIWKEISI